MPVTRERTFARQRSTVVTARAFVTEVMAAAGLVTCVEEALLCTSELATNAITHGSPPGRNILVRVVIDDARLRIEVHDAGSGLPYICTTTADEPHGRGLFVVSELADDWGVADRVGHGKAVWAEFKLDHGPVTLAC